MTINEVYSIEKSHFQFQINSKNWFLKGWSRAGLKTGFMLYPFKILFDCGIFTPSKPDIIFLTHQHVDHMQCIAHICTSHKPNFTTIYLPETSIKYITKYERIITELSNTESESLTDEEILKHQKINLIGKNSSDIFNINHELQVEVLKGYHDVQSNGYGFSSWKKIIKPEFEYLTKNSSNSIEEQERINKLKELKIQNINIYEKILNPEFAFYCDSKINNLSDHNEWKKYPVIICECTGLTNNGDYIDFNHTSLMKLKPIMLENIDKKWLLIHISLSCSDEIIKNIEKELRNEGINVTICF